MIDTTPYPTSKNGVLILLCFSITMMGLAVIFQTQLLNRQIGKSNNAYTRATNCFAATSPTKRTPDYVKECYDKAEKAAGVKIDHYGDGK